MRASPSQGHYPTGASEAAPGRVYVREMVRCVRQAGTTQAPDEDRTCAGASKAGMCGACACGWQQLATVVGNNYMCFGHVMGGCGAVGV